MDKLEKEIGGSLLDAGPNGVRLTELGRRCYPVISDVVKKYDSSLEIMRGFVEKNDEDLSVLLEFQYFPYILPRDLFSKIGDMTVKSAVADSRKQCITDVADGKYDLAVIIRPDDHSLPAGLCYMPLKKEEYFLLMNAGNPLAKKEAVEIDDLQNEEIILPCTDYTFFQSFINACLAHDFYPKFSDEIIGLGLCLQRVAEGQGILLSPDLKEALDVYPDIVVRPLSEPSLRVELGVLTRSDCQDRLMVHSYINALRIMMEDNSYNFRLQPPMQEM